MLGDIETSFFQCYDASKTTTSRSCDRLLRNPRRGLRNGRTTRRQSRSAGARFIDGGKLGLSLRGLSLLQSFILFILKPLRLSACYARRRSVLHLRIFHFRILRYSAVCACLRSILNISYHLPINLILKRP